MTPHHLAAIIRRAHAIGEHPENQCWTHVYPREWQDMIVAALEAFGAAQAGQAPSRDDIAWIIDRVSAGHVKHQYYSPSLRALAKADAILTLFSPPEGK
jgi:hypothetical protein